MTTSLKAIHGKAWLFGDNVDTDQIIQGRYLTLLDYSEMAKHAFEIPRPEFSREVKKRTWEEDHLEKKPLAHCNSWELGVSCPSPSLDCSTATQSTLGFLC
jgi:hypothetical protein